MANLIEAYLNTEKLNLNLDLKLIQLCQGIDSSLVSNNTLCEKIEKVMQPFAEKMKLNSETVHNFANRIKNNRVNITHGKNRTKVFTKNELATAVAVLEVCCQLYLFDKLGIENIYITVFYNEINNIKTNTGIDPLSLFKNSTQSK